MSTWVFAVAFLAVAFLLVHFMVRKAVFERLPLAEGELVLLDEHDLRVYRKIRRTPSGHSLTYNVRVVVTDRRIYLATGGPEGKYKFFLLAIVDYVSPAPPDSSYGTWRNGYPTYHVRPTDLTFIEEDGRPAVRIVVTSPSPGPLFDQPELILYTHQPDRWRELFAAPAPA